MECLFWTWRVVCENPEVSYGGVAAVVLGLVWLLALANVVVDIQEYDFTDSCCQRRLRTSVCLLLCLSLLGGPLPVLAGTLLPLWPLWLAAKKMRSALADAFQPELEALQKRLDIKERIARRRQRAENRALSRVKGNSR
jgi:hypothetical protein